MTGRFGGRTSDKSGVRDMATDAVGVAWEKQYREALAQWEAEGRKGPTPDPKSFGIEGKDEYRDEQFEDAELARGEEEDPRGRWGGRGSDKAGARNMNPEAHLKMAKNFEEMAAKSQSYPDAQQKYKELAEQNRQKAKELGAKDFAMDPLTPKGEEIMSNMKEEYGPEKGKSVFYASANKGKITGVHS